MTDDEWNEVIAVNLTGPMFLTRAAVPVMQAHLADPADVAEAALFLVSDLSRTVTGQIVTARAVAGAAVAAPAGVDAP